VVYICDDRIHDDIAYIEGSTKGTRNYRDSLPKRKPNTSQETWEMLQGYISRAFSFDADGLNAIYGAVETMSRAESPVYHIWGVPIASLQHRPDGKDYYIDEKRTSWYGGTDVYMALHWTHRNPCQRRVGFPTCSPLGWKGGAKFPTSFQHRTSVDCDINPWHEGAYQALPTIIANGGFVHGDAFSLQSQRLQVTAKTIKLEVEYVEDWEWSANHWNATNGWFICLPFGEGSDCFVQPIWDDAAMDERPKDAGPLTFLCAVVQETAVDATKLLWVPMMLILRDCGEYFERVGRLAVYPDYRDCNAFTRDASGVKSIGTSYIFERGDNSKLPSK
jgi:hypothetical protein